MSSLVRQTVTPFFSIRCSSLRSLCSPPLLVCAISASTSTPRLTAASKRVFELVEVESENDNDQPPPGPLHGREQWGDALIGLRNQPHVKA